ncbi:MAG: dienelactone hydrolase family protein [Alphaproteobacteria bacterium]|nr:dienelactone hydrolase family protein [Alphaproteobacteria bacterium]
MTGSAITNFYTHQRSDKPPASIALLLHGLGSNGRDLISLAPYWEQALPDTLFISPDAPFACDMVPPGYPDSYQWFSLQDRDPDKILAGVLAAAPILNAFIAEQLEQYKLPASKLALIGFSQGTMMSLYAGLHYPEKLAGVLGYSGALVWPPETDAAKLQKLPIRLIHGEADDVVPVSAYRMAREVLEKSGFDVSGHTTPGLPHSIDGQGVESGNEFLSTILA